MRHSYFNYPTQPRANNEMKKPKIGAGLENRTSNQRMTYLDFSKLCEEFDIRLSYVRTCILNFEENKKRLSQMFPSLPEEVLKCLLESSEGDADKVEMWLKNKGWKAHSAYRPLSASASAETFQQATKAMSKRKFDRGHRVRESIPSPRDDQHQRDNQVYGLVSEEKVNPLWNPLDDSTQAQQGRKEDLMISRRKLHAPNPKFQFVEAFATGHPLTSSSSQPSPTSYGKVGVHTSESSKSTPFSISAIRSLFTPRSPQSPSLDKHTKKSTTPASVKRRVAHFSQARADVANKSPGRHIV